MTNKINNKAIQDSQKSERIPWHTAFFEAIQLELEDYQHILEFHFEYPLTAEPLRIDVLVIKKLKDIPIEKNIAAIFRRENLLEYKSPGDYISIRDFYKVYGYACLYTSLANVPVSEVTITFVESRYPRDVIAHLREVRKYEVEEKWPGIYIVKGDILPIQIIDSRRLSSEENLWLKDLSKRLEAQELERITLEIHRQGKEAKIRAYLEAIYHGNIEQVEEAIKMSKSALTLDMVFENTGLAARWEAKGVAVGEARGVAIGEAKGIVIGEAKGVEKKALEVAKNMLGSGFSLEQTARLSGLDIEKVRHLADG